MNPVLEMSLVAVFIGAAAIYLVSRIVAGIRKSAMTGCGGSCRCETGTPEKENRLGRRIELVELGGLRSHDHGEWTRP